MISLEHNGTTYDGFTAEELSVRGVPDAVIDQAINQKLSAEANRRILGMLDGVYTNSTALDAIYAETEEEVRRILLDKWALHEELTAKMKTCKVKWSKKAKLAYNKQKVECNVCGKVLNRGGISYHKSSSRHKKALRKLRRKEPSGNRSKAAGKTRKNRK